MDIPQIIFGARKILHDPKVVGSGEDMQKYVGDKAIKKES